MIQVDSGGRNFPQRFLWQGSDAHHSLELLPTNMETQAGHIVNLQRAKKRVFMSYQRKRLLGTSHY